VSGTGALTLAAGFAGKIPARGDFLRAGLPSSFAQPWDDWLAAGLAAARETLSDGFDEAYMEAPVWRFALAAGAAGPDAAAGVLLPSVDRVGRRFPLTVALVLPGADPLGLAADAAWFDAIEDAARGAVECDTEPDELTARLAAIAPPELGFLPERAPLPEGGALQDAWALIARLAADAAHSLWWTAGAPRVAPHAFVSRGLPDLAAMMVDQ